MGYAAPPVAQSDIEPLNKIRGFCIWAAAYLFFERDTRIFGNVYKFKGMENYFIVLAYLSGCLDRKNFEDLPYVWMLRASFGLNVLVDSKAMELLNALKGCAD